MLALAEQRIDALFAVLVGAALLMASLRVAMVVAQRSVARADASAMRRVTSGTPNASGSGPPAGATTS